MNKHKLLFNFLEKHLKDKKLNLELLIRNTFNEIHSKRENFPLKETTLDEALGQYAIKWEREKAVKSRILEEKISNKELDSFLDNSYKNVMQSYQEISFFYLYMFKQRIYEIDETLGKELLDREFTGFLTLDMLLENSFHSALIDVRNIKNEYFSDHEYVFFWSEMPFDEQKKDRFPKLWIYTINLTHNIFKFCSFFLDEEAKINLEQVGEEGRNIYHGTSLDMTQEEYRNYCRYINLLLYLLSDNVDSKQTNKSDYYIKTNKKNCEVESKLFYSGSPSIFKVGEIVGNRINRIHTAIQNSDKDKNITGTPKRPHIRSGHFHQFWKGSKTDNNIHRHLITKYVETTFINMDV